MGIPFKQAAKIGSYVVKQHLTGVKRYPLVLMLEPLFRCNLACAGCGKIDYPDDILNQRLSYDECMQAMDECGAPAVSIAGGEPLLHRDMPKIVEGFLAKDKFVILCTNALLLKKKIGDYKPSPFSPGRSTSMATSKCTTSRSARTGSTIPRSKRSTWRWKRASASRSTAPCSTMPIRRGWPISLTSWRRGASRLAGLRIN